MEFCRSEIRFQIPFPCNQAGDSCFGISTSKLPPGSVIPDNLPPGHISVTGVTPAQLQGAVDEVKGKLLN